MTVWLAWNYDYERTSVLAIGATKADALNAVKSNFGHPYRATWSEERDQLVGVFEAVPNWSTAHTMYVDFEELNVAGAA